MTEQVPTDDSSIDSAASALSAGFGAERYKMRYIAMVARKSRDAPEFFAPLSYGRGKELGHELLLRRGRATMFATDREAWAALEATLKQATAEGDVWPKKFQYAIIEVEEAPN